MSILFRKHSTLISIAILLAVIAVWQFPSVRLMFVMILLLFSVLRAIGSVVTKHREAYLQGKTTRVVFIRNVLFEIIGILVAMTLAGLLGIYIAQIVTQQISNELIKFTTSIATGLLVGIGVGIIMQHIWGRFIKTSAEN